MNGYEIGAPILMVVVGWALRYLFFDFQRVRARKRAQREEYRAQDSFVASIRLRLPPGAELVELEHQVRFDDVRKRTAASEVLQNNNFTVSTAETYDKTTTYWLLAKRATLVDHSVGEVQTVAQFVTRYGGRYDCCNPAL